MDLPSFIQSYFLNPIWDRTGYNMVNTLAYAAIALGALYLIWKIFEQKKFFIDRAFWAGALAFVLWGSSLRVLTDSIDSPSRTMANTLLASGAGSGAGVVAGNPFGFIAQAAYPFILNSHVLDYGFLTVTPGIYVLTAGLFLLCIALGIWVKRPYLAAGVGLAAAALNYLLLLPMMKHWEYTAVIVGVAGGVGAIVYYGLKWKDKKWVLPVMGQALDGVATWVAIDWFGPANGINYFEQHVLSNSIGQATPLGFGLFFLLKIGFSLGAVWLVRQEKDIDENTKSLLLLVVAIIGFAPGLRDLLRLLCGT